jgi:signal transduction histidine kinase
MLESIDVTSTRMGRIIDGFLDMAHLQLGRPLELERRPTDVTPLVRQVADECQQSTSRHRIMLEAENEVVANCDSIRLQRALSNLLENAVKYSPQGGTIRVVLHRDTHHAVAVLRVKDDGLGIPEADLPRIFDRFRRGSNVMGGIAGTGIGLASVRQIVEEHGGTISVESQVGLGTEVKVRLPLELNLEQDDLMPAEPGADGGGRGGDEPEG